MTAKLERDTSNTIHHGYIGINAKPELPKQGVALFANFKEINSEDFEFIFEEDPGDKPTTTSRQALKEEFDPLIDSAVINIEHLIFEGNLLTQSSFNFYPTPTGYELDVLSNEAIGEITFEVNTDIAKKLKVEVSLDDTKYKNSWLSGLRLALIAAKLGFAIGPRGNPLIL